MTHLMTNLPLAFMGIGPMEMVIVGIIAVLLFGKRLPEVGRSLGKGLMEFKKGVSGIQDELYGATNPPARSTTASSSSRFSDIDDRDEATAPKFEPPTAAPQDQATVG
ncbi:MAG: twin-arginine translocase TatA/TatE family subunit [Pirellulales bacterium]